MIFRWRKTGAEVKANSKDEDINLVLIPVYQGKTKSAFGHRIVKIIQKSNFCSSSPLVKRIIIKNVEVCCIVIETSGTKSVKIICASVPYMVNLISRASPKFKAVLEDERVVQYINFFQEIDFESLLSSVCAATIVIHKGVTKWYPVVCVQLGRDALIFGKNWLQYLLHLFMEGVVSAVHYACEDLPHVLQSLCAQNYTVAKYFVENLPYIALGGAKSFVLFTLFLQRVVTAGLKYSKRFVKFLRRILLNMSSKINVRKILLEVCSYLKCIITFITSGETYGFLKSSLVTFLKWLVPILKETVPVIWIEIVNFLKNLAPFLQNVIQLVVKSIPKIYKFCEDNMATLIQLCNYSQHFVKSLYQIIKPYSEKLYRAIHSSAESVPQIVYFLLRIINHIFSKIQGAVKYFILYNPHVRKIFYCLLIQVKDFNSVICDLTLNGYHALVAQLKFILKQLHSYLPVIISCISRISQDSFYLLQEIFPIFKPAVAEVSSTFYQSSKEMTSKSVLGVQRIVPSIWSGIKIVTPVTIRATYDIVSTTKASAAVIYPDILKAVFVVSPELSKGLVIVVQDSSRACMEITSVSCVASQEVILVLKSISVQLPTILKAVSKVSMTTSGAMIEVISTSSKGGSRVLSDLHSAIQAVNSAYNLAELEILTVVNELLSEINNNVSDSEEIQEVLILLSETSSVILTMANKHFCLAYEDISSRVIAYSTNAVLEACKNFKNLSFHLLLNLMNFLNYAIKQSSLISGLKGPVSLSTNSYLQRIALYFKNIVSEVSSITSVAVYEYFHQFCQKALLSALIITPRLWENSKYINAIIWQHFCNLSSDLWDLLEVAASSTWEMICVCTPELWDFFKSFSFRTWEMTCEMSPVLWESMLPLAPILWSSNRDVVQCIWEFHVRTCNNTWRVFIPMSSASWEYMVDNFPKAWFILCENSKSQWNSLCCAVESSWNTVTRTSSFSWVVFHKTVSKSWKHALRPMTKSTCQSATSAVTKSVKLSYNVCLKTKKLIFFL